VITTAHQDILASWLCQKIGLVPSPAIRCIGQIHDGQIVGVVGFDGYNTASVMMHVAGDGAWCSRSLLFAAFDYPFNRLHCNIVIGLVPSGNKAAVKFNERVGFKLENELKGAHPDGSLLLMTMRREDCRFLEARYGKEVQSPAST
jgi:RimJ/RimL family protein N-acetyltransferase